MRQHFVSSYYYNISYESTYTFDTTILLTFVQIEQTKFVILVFVNVEKPFQFHHQKFAETKAIISTQDT